MDYRGGFWEIDLREWTTGSGFEAVDIRELGLGVDYMGWISGLGCRKWIL